MEEEFIDLTHGSGAAATERLIRRVLLPRVTIRRALEGIGLDELADGSSLKVGEFEIVSSIDGHTVYPIFFPGGDIGRLSVTGTTNDLAMMGAKPVAILDSMIIEEGFPILKLERIVQSMNETAEEISVAIIGGDMKVMPRGRIDQLVITTSGIGVAKRGEVIVDSGASDGDKVIVTGPIGDHGVALLSSREGLGFDTELRSDAAPLWETIEATLKTGGVTAMKDPTRGGVAMALNEIAEKSRVSITVKEEEVPIRESVVAASEMLGLDPFDITCEGVAIICIRPEKAEEAVHSIRKTRYGREARIIGDVRLENPGYVLLETSVGGTRIIEKPEGPPIPRVC
jgi:hydrogenase expression/formation protein HypE